MTEYAFDVTIRAAIRVKANSRAEAEALMHEHICQVDANFGAWPNGDPINGEASIDTEVPLHLYQVDGEDTPTWKVTLRDGYGNISEMIVCAWDEKEAIKLAREYAAREEGCLPTDESWKEDLAQYEIQKVEKLN